LSEELRTPRILLAGIAKNEAAYLPEWIFHHLNIGVAGVLVYINNTDDNSAQILDKIAENHPVSYEFADDIASNTSTNILKRIGEHFLEYSPLQSKSYAQIYQQTDASEYDYILYLDVDEYLCLDQKLSELTQENLFRHPVICFQWFSVTGDKKAFATLDKDVKGEFDQFSKYMIKTGQEDAKFFSCHIARLNDDLFHRYSGGLILHRVLRSRLEYLALIARSNPTQNNLSNGFKMNRRGWTSYGPKSLDKKYHYLFEQYSLRFDQFCDSNHLAEQLQVARDNVISRSHIVINDMKMLKQQNNELGKVLMGTGISNLSPLKWLFLEVSNRMVRLLFPSLTIKHVPIISHIKFKLKLYKSDNFLD